MVGRTIARNNNLIILINHGANLLQNTGNPCSSLTLCRRKEAISHISRWVNNAVSFVGALVTANRFAPQGFAGVTVHLHIADHIERQ